MEMESIGRRLFTKINKRKQSTHHNHDVHILAREINEWLPSGIQAMQNGSYTPRPLKRYFFADEMVDQLYIADRVLQHILLQQLKPTFKHVMSPNCYHLAGPSGVQHATDRIRKVLKEENPQYVLRVDVKSFYKSISHFRLIKIIKENYDDPKVILMLENIVTNLIDTPRGFINPGNGIALRGPLSQFFSGLFLKKLDDAFNHMQVYYYRFQDDILILCQSKHQLNKCRRIMMEILHEKGLSLSRKKSYMGSINKSFHFLGIHYFPTRPGNSNTNVTQVNDASKSNNQVENSLDDSGGEDNF